MLSSELKVLRKASSVVRRWTASGIAVLCILLQLDRIWLLALIILGPAHNFVSALCNHYGTADLLSGFILPPPMQPTFQAEPILCSSIMLLLIYKFGKIY